MSETSAATAACPVCAEIIPAAANKCRYCNEWIHVPRDTPAEEPEPRRTPRPSASDAMSARPPRRVRGKRVLAGLAVGSGGVAGVMALVVAVFDDRATVATIVSELGLFGVAMYVALVPACLVLAAVTTSWPPDLRGNDRSSVSVMLLLTFVLALLVRFQLFGGSPGDLQVEGSLAALVVVVVAGWGLRTLQQLRRT